MSTRIEPFRIHVDDAVLDDLQQRLARTRLPDQIPDTGWEYGTELECEPEAGPTGPPIVHNSIVAGLADLVRHADRIVVGRVGARRYGAPPRSMACWPITSRNVASTFTCSRPSQ